MTSPEPRPRLKSLTTTPDQPSTAEPAEAPTGRSAPKVAGRQAVPSSVRPDPQAGDGRTPIAWLHITAPPSKYATPTATSRCECGHHLHAIGQQRVLDLIALHTAHRDTCPLRTRSDGRNAA